MSQHSIERTSFSLQRIFMQSIEVVLMLFLLEVLSEIENAVVYTGTQGTALCTAAVGRA